MGGQQIYRIGLIIAVLAAGAYAEKPATKPAKHPATQPSTQPATQPSADVDYKSIREIMDSLPADHRPKTAKDWNEFNISAANDWYGINTKDKHFSAALKLIDKRLMDKTISLIFSSKEFKESPFGTVKSTIVVSLPPSEKLSVANYKIGESFTVQGETNGFSIYGAPEGFHVTLHLNEPSVAPVKATTH